MIKFLGPFSYFQGYIRKSCLVEAKVIKFARSRPMFQSLPNLYDQKNSGLYYGNLDFNFNVDAGKTLLNLDQMYLNVHYRLKHVSRF